MIKTLGCCDSGIGGMIIVNELHKVYPKLNIVYIADQINAPYGDKTLQQIQQYQLNFLEAFKKMNIHEIVIACNTLCANGVQNEQFPEMNIHMIIEPTCQQMKGYNFKKINVLATSYTISQHVYGNQLKKIFPDATIQEIAAPEFVPIIENGCDLNLLEKAVARYDSLNADAWVLGCTHFPLIRPYIENKGMIFDSISPVLQLFQNEDIEGEGKVIVYTTGDPQKMKDSIRKIFHCEYDVHSIQLEHS